MRRVARLSIVAVALAAVLSSSGCSILDVPTEQLLSPPKSSGANPAPAAPPKVVPAANTATASIEATGPVPVIKSVSSAETTALVAQGATLVDLRDAAAFKKKRIDGATNVPMSTFVKKAKDWPQDAPVVLYCDNGYKARSARSWLARKGFSQVYDLRGGLEGWEGGLIGTDVPKKLAKPQLYYFYSSFWEKWQLPEYVQAWKALQSDLEREYKGKVEVIKVDLTDWKTVEKHKLKKFPTWRLVDRDNNKKDWLGDEDLGSIKPTVAKVAAGGKLK